MRRAFCGYFYAATASFDLCGLCTPGTLDTSLSRQEIKLRSLARISWFLGVVAALSWLLVLVVSLFGAAALDQEAPPLAIILTVMVTVFVMELPVRWIEKRRGKDALRIRSSNAFLIELPGFVGLLAVGAALTWSRDPGTAVLACTFVSVWAVAAPLVTWSRHRSNAAIS